MQHLSYDASEYINLPDVPGVYKFYNSKGVIIYVGKAKSLKKRVASYFNKASLQNRKTYRLISEIDQIEITVVESEFDALLLENNLIKENQPKYNILLKDDKSFPYLVITRERFPKIHATRRVTHTYGEYFGPYSSVKAMNNVLELVRRLFYVRTCNLNLSERNIQQKKFKVCLEYHLGNCKGPCEGFQIEQSYLTDIQKARDILKGQISVVRNAFKESMMEASENLAFETAQHYKDRLDLLEKFQSKSEIVNTKIQQSDTFTIIKSEKYAYVNYMYLSEGNIRASETFAIQTKLDESEKEVLEYVIPKIREKYQSTAKEIYSNWEADIWEDAILIVPKIGDKKKLVELSLKNALFYKRAKEINQEEFKTKVNPVLAQLKEDLRLNQLPSHIECFDNSNIQGTNPVAAMVCFLNGKPAKKEYRHYNIKTVLGPDDFSSMTEIVSRRYKRLIDENKPLPNLIVIDGGKGQLSASCKALQELGIYGQIPIIGIAKKLEEIYYPEDSIPLHISKKSSSLKLIQYLRDEAHRFAISFHRQKRSKQAIQSEMDAIKGLGPKTKELLLKKLKTIKNIKETDEKILAEIIGNNKAKLLINSFKKKGNPN